MKKNRIVIEVDSGVATFLTADRDDVEVLVIDNDTGEATCFIMPLGDIEKGSQRSADINQLFNHWDIE